jgi:hypothetical protein
MRLSEDPENVAAGADRYAQALSAQSVVFKSLSSRCKDGNGERCDRPESMHAMHRAQVALKIRLDFIESLGLRP